MACSLKMSINVGSPIVGGVLTITAVVLISELESRYLIKLIPSSDTVNCPLFIILFGEQVSPKQVDVCPLINIPEPGDTMDPI